MITAVIVRISVESYQDKWKKDVANSKTHLAKRKQYLCDKLKKKGG